jgi:hypothetical protein
MHASRGLRDSKMPGDLGYGQVLLIVEDNRRTLLRR